MKKFIMFGVLAVLVVVALLAFVVMPTAPLAVDDGTVAASGVTAAAGAALPEGSSLIVPAVELSERAPVQQSPVATYMLIALGASLLVITFAYRRRLVKLFDLTTINLRRLSGRSSEGAIAGGGPNKFILPMAA